MNTQQAKRDGRSKKRPGVSEQRRVVTEAAVSLFVERGCDAVNVSDICNAAGVSRPTFYRCFAGKDALLAHVYAVAVNDHVEINLASVLREGRPLTGLRGELESMTDRIFERPTIAAFLFAESADERSPAHTIVERTFDDAARRIEEWYRASGRVAPSRTTLKATMVACQWIVHDAIRRGLTAKRRAEAKHALWELTRAVFATRQRRDPAGPTTKK
jgi:AcrR family transcriptional regulator